MLTRSGPTEVDSADAPFTDAERGSIRNQIEKQWMVDGGTPNLDKMKVTISLEMNPDGTVQSATIEPSNDNDNPDWRSFAESCRRAIYRSSPLRMPRDKPYAAWRHIMLTFNAKEMFDQ